MEMFRTDADIRSPKSMPPSHTFAAIPARKFLFDYQRNQADVARENNSKASSWRVATSAQSFSQTPLPLLPLMPTKPPAPLAAPTKA